ncbi:Glycosyl transferase family 2 [Psychroflexus salarius]|uniref:Glycosyl transferase family 2 n=1 Tax=Psychroflexus salarius TaxID=1155689 RepID=A0A1M4W746_9FLAO|nr:glycosyltransferase family A protein [Psychroflexus salarius]SHE76975.1 Glycosyl transferase family 2 [Psychroflexus salarius]
MNRSKLDFLDSMFPHHDWRDLNLVIINQSKTQELKSPCSKHCIINSTEFGLSKSRNLALENCKTNFAVIADDDVIYEPDCLINYVETINTYQNVALFSFQMLNFENQLAKKYPKTSCLFRRAPKKIKASSVEMLLNTNLIKSNQLKFDQQFGLGAVFESGEDEVFLNEILSEKLRWYFINKIILKHPEQSTGQKQHELNYITTKTVLKYRIYGNFVFLWLFKFLLYLVRNEYIQPLEIPQTFKACYRAVTLYKSLERKEM